MEILERKKLFGEKLKDFSKGFSLEALTSPLSIFGAGYLGQGLDKKWGTDFLEETAIIGYASALVITSAYKAYKTYRNSRKN